jgi:hypothetical protein
MNKRTGKSVGVVECPIQARAHYGEVLFRVMVFDIFSKMIPKKIAHISVVPTFEILCFMNAFTRLKDFFVFDYVVTGVAVRSSIMPGR